MEDNSGSHEAVPDAIERLEDILIDRLAWAKSDTSAIRMKAIGQLRIVRKLISSDGPRQEVVKSLFKKNYISMLMTNAPVLLRFPDATDEALRTVIGISRTTDQGMSARIIPALFEHGALIFSILALKEHRTVSNSINIQGLELMNCMLQFVSKAQKKEKEEGEEEDRERPSSRGKNSTLRSTLNSTGPQFDQQRDTAAKLVQDAVHQLLLHGAAALLVRMLASSISSTSETATRRAIYCTRFLLENTPPQMTLKFATYNNFSATRSLCQIFGDKTSATKLEGAALLTGLLSSSVEVAELITSLGAWDQLSTVLATHAESVELPRHWLVGSLSNIRRLGEDPVLKQRMDRKAAATAAVAGGGGGGAGDLADSSLVTGSSVEGGEESVDMEGSFKHLLQSMLQAAMDGGGGAESGGMAYSSSQTSFQRAQAQSVEFSGAMQMVSALSTPNLNAQHLHRPESSGARGQRPRSRPGSRGATGRLYSSGSGAKPHNIRPSSASAVSSARAFISSREGQMRRGEEGGEDVAALLEGSAASSYHQGQGMNSMFVKRLKKSPLGMPVDPDKIRQLRRQNKGQLPDYLPHALGGPELGHRPGPDYGSKVKKPQGQASVPAANSPPPSPKRGGGGAGTLSGSRTQTQAEFKVAPTIKVLPVAEKGEGEEGGAPDIDPLHPRRHSR